MVLFIGIFVATILFFGLLFLELARSDQRAQSQGYGPRSQIGGAPCATGKLTCVSYKVPILGGPMSFAWSLDLHCDGRNVTGTFEYIGRPRNFSGSLFLSFSGTRVKGRFRMGDLRVCEGTVGPGGARLTLGHPKGGILGFLKGRYEYSVRRGKAHFDRTAHHGHISKNSELLIENGRISGRLIHGPQETWAVDVDVPFTDIKDEAATLAVVLACDLILGYYHDGVHSTVTD